MKTTLSDFAFANRAPSAANRDRAHLYDARDHPAVVRDDGFVIESCDYDSHHRHVTATASQGVSIVFYLAVGGMTVQESADETAKRNAANPINRVDPTGLLSSWGWSEFTWLSDVPSLLEAAAARFTLSAADRAKYVAPSDDNATGFDILKEFFSEVGPKHRTFGNNAFMTKVIKDHWAVDEGRREAFSEAIQGRFGKYSIDDDERTLSPDQRTVRALWDMMRIYINEKTEGDIGNMGFIGSYHGTVVAARNGDKMTLTFKLHNQTDKNSGAGLGPDRAITQDWEWTEEYPVPCQTIEDKLQRQAREKEFQGHEPPRSW